MGRAAVPRRAAEWQQYSGERQACDFARWRARASRYSRCSSWPSTRRAHRLPTERRDVHRPDDPGARRLLQRRRRRDPGDEPAQGQKVDVKSGRKPLHRASRRGARPGAREVGGREGVRLQRLVKRLRSPADRGPGLGAREAAGRARRRGGRAARRTPRPRRTSSGSTRRRASGTSRRPEAKATARGTGR